MALVCHGIRNWETDQEGYVTYIRDPDYKFNVIIVDSELCSDDIEYYKMLSKEYPGQVLWRGKNITSQHHPGQKATANMRYVLNKNKYYIYITHKKDMKTQKQAALEHLSQTKHLLQCDNCLYPTATTDGVIAIWTEDLPVNLKYKGEDITYELTEHDPRAYFFPISY